MWRIKRGAAVCVLATIISFIVLSAGNLTHHDTTTVALVATPIGLVLWFFTDFRRPSGLYTTMLFFGVAVGCWGYLTMS